MASCLYCWARCNLLRWAPFTACSRQIDPEPFVTTCTEMMCKYPAEDGLKCRFLEAYARACSHHSNITVEGWKSKVESKSRQTRCICRAIFASKYKSTGAFGELA